MNLREARALAIDIDWQIINPMDDFEQTRTAYHKLMRSNPATADLRKDDLALAHAIMHRVGLAGKKEA